MNFQFTEEQTRMQKVVRDFVKQEVAPFVPEMEKGRFPTSLLKKMAERGWMGLPIPAKYNGAGHDFITYMMTIHELSKKSAVLGAVLSVHTSIVTIPILLNGNERQKEHYVKKLAAGQYLGAFCLTEPSAGSDAGSLKTRAEKRGDTYVLNGTKVFITNGGAADIYLVFASTDPEAGTGGISAFIVEKGRPGFFIGKNEEKMGLHGSLTVTLNFDNAVIPARQLLGEEGMGFKIALSNLDTGRIGIAAQALGIAEGALSEAVQFLKKRYPDGELYKNGQALAFKLADMAARTEAARLLVYQAASLKQQGMQTGKAASMAKLFASETAMYVAGEAVQLLGDFGYTKDFSAERYFRDAKVCEIYEGTSEIQRIVIGKHL
ncbi:acyl-CoA dehydrogenase family protein [Bacillus sp. FSL M8-0315]|uniref:acyl-CoA dehydrogenase family protein n=1 Tax=Bacillus TaxID=1386 RepID=UPI0008FAFB8A|nr:acyl-CoA dehydrogenase family protein [Bacillus licheniformis]MEC5226662.1 acyl-CoA dehydrogenase family protein [Bacillus licheniformis]OIS81231.1 acyl-CoA dehydrogenase [Bacillus licheniformis]OIS83350.1 acyl-CoA dehydrogenase [Bacillus licheniformis]OIS84248.1 acyl-CoA dehydrogenase [Bacillus licheniformis]OIS88849.1 acyl-CoA dehydrogenase [Bacillus licheniformis]